MTDGVRDRREYVDAETGEVYVGEVLPAVTEQGSTTLATMPATDLRAQLEAYKTNREILKQFIRDHLVESEYRNGYPIPGRMGDYYRVRGTDAYALTKAGAEKLANLFQLYRDRAETREETLLPDFVAVTMRVRIVDARGHVKGAGEASCTSAESSFQSERAKKKYGFTESGTGDWRAALNDIKGRATKRAYVQAVTSALAIAEIFQEIQRDAEQQRPCGVEASDGSIIPVDDQGRPTLVPVGRFVGRPFTAVPTADLRRMLATCEQHHRSPELQDKLREVLEDRRAGADEANGS